MSKLQAVWGNAGIIKRTYGVERFIPVIKSIDDGEVCLHPSQVRPNPPEGQEVLLTVGGTATTETLFTSYEVAEKGTVSALYESLGAVGAGLFVDEQILAFCRDFPHKVGDENHKNIFRTGEGIVCIFGRNDLVVREKFSFKDTRVFTPEDGFLFRIPHKII